jgi:hypothetical protein
LHPSVAADGVIQAIEGVADHSKDLAHPKLAERFHDAFTHVGQWRSPFPEGC